MKVGKDLVPGPSYGELLAARAEGLDGLVATLDDSLVDEVAWPLSTWPIMGEPTPVCGGLLSNNLLTFGPLNICDRPGWWVL